MGADALDSAGTGTASAAPVPEDARQAPVRRRVLVVDDEPAACARVEDLLRHDGYDVATARNAIRGLDLLGRVRPEVVVTELRIPGLDGFAFMERARRVAPWTRILVLTAFGSVGAAVDAMRCGADDFMEKPVDETTLRRALRRSMERASRLPEARSGSEPGAGISDCRGVVADHPSMRSVLQRAEQVAASRATVLLTGESGTGKGLMAETIHRMSCRARGPFVELTCAALSDSLLDSELFGHEKGAFTGAVCRHEGRFMHAKGGTLFLDEIGSCPLATQVKLLRFLQTRRFERVGGNDTLSVDVRLVAATKRDLKAEVAKARFREDLYYRLNVVHVRLPPLRHRRSDVPALAEIFLARYAAENRRRLDGFSRDALDRLLAYSWPGNVRELEHAVEHAVVMARGRRIEAHDLPEPVVRPPRDRLEVAIPGSTLAEIERSAILKSLMAVGGKATQAAAMLGISKSKIYYRLRDYGCGPPDSD
jgi:DNA-binding NtrC family response regulator